jgi:hypothetical protein
MEEAHSVSFEELVRRRESTVVENINEYLKN